MFQPISRRFPEVCSGTVVFGFAKKKPKKQGSVLKF
jgi:hypothetical protein